MNVSCAECGSVFRVDPAKIPEAGVRARCSICGGVIAIGKSGVIDDDFASPPTAMAAVGTPPSGAARAGAPASPVPPARQASPALDDDPFATPRRAMPSPERPMPPVASPPMAAPAIPRPAVTREEPSHDVSPVRESPRHEPPRVTAMPSPASPLPITPRENQPVTPRESQPVTPRGGQPVTPRGSQPVTPSSVPAARSPEAAALPAAGGPGTGLPPRQAPERPPARPPINPFLANDPNQKAKRLARALISDIIAYHPEKHAEALRNGSLKELFREEIKKSYEEYVDQMGREFAEATTHFQDALNDVLAGGKKVF